MRLIYEDAKVQKTIFELLVLFSFLISYTEVSSDRTEMNPNLDVIITYAKNPLLGKY